MTYISHQKLFWPVQYSAGYQPGPVGQIRADAASLASDQNKDQYDQYTIEMIGGMIGPR